MFGGLTFEQKGKRSRYVASPSSFAEKKHHERIGKRDTGKKWREKKRSTMDEIQVPEIVNSVQTGEVVSLLQRSATCFVICIVYGPLVASPAVLNRACKFGPHLPVATPVIPTPSSLRFTVRDCLLLSLFALLLV